MDSVQREIFKLLFTSIAEEMGLTLQRSSYSPNIKERRDYSCAVFDRFGELVSLAAHIPVHLGAMPASVEACLKRLDLRQGDIAVLNDPYAGGSHLPDITMVSPYFGDDPQGAQFYVASRAHHADIGGMAPGSMPVANEIFQEGLILPPTLLVRDGELVAETHDLILSNTRTPQERRGDLLAQLGSIERGLKRLEALQSDWGSSRLAHAAGDLKKYTEKIVRAVINDIPDGTYQFLDYMDDDGFSSQNIAIRCSLSIDGDEVLIDFEGTAPQQDGNINAPFAVTLSAVFYVFRSLLSKEVPSNHGIMAPISVSADAGSLLNPIPPAAVAAGNVETSQRIVDVLLGALAQALPEVIPAASQGTMNNLTMGGLNSKGERYTYYETIGGGMGASASAPGANAIHSHMTNTRNTPVEVLETELPLRILEYAVRANSGGKGKSSGGNGIRRIIEFLLDTQIGMISERRRLGPYGLQHGQPGEPGINRLVGADGPEYLPGKFQRAVQEGDILEVETPGGGGFGEVVQ